MADLRHHQFCPLCPSTPEYASELPDCHRAFYQVNLYRHYHFHSFLISNDFCFWCNIFYLTGLHLFSVESWSVFWQCSHPDLVFFPKGRNSNLVLIIKMILREKKIWFFLDNWIWIWIRFFSVVGSGSANLLRKYYQSYPALETKERKRYTVQMPQINCSNF